MSNYNPFISAFNELVSEQAVYHYQKTAWAHAQRSIDDSIIAITYTVAAVTMLAKFAYDLGAAFGEGHYSAVCTHTKASGTPQPCLPTPRPIALLAPAPMTLAGYRPIAALPAARLAKSLSDTDEFRRDRLNALTKTQLIAMAKKRGLRATRTMAKPALIKLLAG